MPSASGPTILKEKYMGRPMAMLILKQMRRLAFFERLHRKLCFLMIVKCLLVMSKILDKVAAHIVILREGGW